MPDPNRLGRDPAPGKFGRLHATRNRPRKYPVEPQAAAPAAGREWNVKRHNCLSSYWCPDCAGKTQEFKRTDGYQSRYCSRCMKEWVWVPKGDRWPGQGWWGRVK